MRDLIKELKDRGYTPICMYCSKYDIKSCICVSFQERRDPESTCDRRKQISKDAKFFFGTPESETISNDWMRWRRRMLMVEYKKCLDRWEAIKKANKTIKVMENLVHGR